jgi:hypothetical protein
MAKQPDAVPALVKHTSEWTAVGVTHMWTYARERLPSMWLVLEADAESSRAGMTAKGAGDND